MDKRSDENCKYTPFLSFRPGRAKERGKPRSKRHNHGRNAVSGRETTRSQVHDPSSRQSSPGFKELSHLPSVPTLSLHRIGGANDPFQSLPVNPHLPEVGNVLDFFLSIWCSTRPTAQSVNSLIPGLVSEVMRKESLLKAVVAYGQAYHECVHEKQTQPSAAFLARLGPLLEHLRALLIRPDEEAKDEAIILIYTLIGMGRLTGVQARETNLHFEGMGRLIRARGGVNKLGMNGVAKAAVIAQQFFTLFSTSNSASMPNPLHNDMAVDIPPISFTEPADLAAPEMFEKISSLPYGFTYFAVNGSLSHGLVEAVTEFNDWLNTPRNIDGDTMLLETIYRTHTMLGSLLNDRGIRSITQRPRSEQNLYLDHVVCLTLEVISVEVFYGTQLHVIGPQLAARMAELASTQFWLCDDNKNAEAGDAALPKKCMAWALMVAAEAADPYPGEIALALMSTIFDLQVFDTEDRTGEDVSHEAKSEMAWEAFYKQVLKEFLCPVFLMKEWKRCWLKYWNSRSSHPG